MNVALKERPIIWEPQEGAQMAFLASDVDEVFYGGAAGGGKTDALLIDATRQLQHSSYRAIIFRRTTKQLRHMIDRSYEIYPKVFQGAKWSDQKLTWTFPWGSKILLWHMEHEKHKYDHDGQEYQYIGFDELQHFTPTQFKYLYSRCRTSDPKLKCYIRSSGMPKGAYVGWVKERYIKCEPYKIVDNVDEDGNLTGLKRQFIPATLDDNKILTDNDPMYENRLRLMGKKLYHALRHGDWSVVEGACFEELNEKDHMAEPCFPPSEATVFRVMDWGYAKPFSVGWYFENYDGLIIRFWEFYGCTGEPDIGLRMSSNDVAKEIRKQEQWFLDNHDIRIGYGVADPACWSKDDDKPSVIENMISEGVYFEKAINDRIQGKMELHSRLTRDIHGDIRFRVTRNCKHWWRTVPDLQADERKPEDVDTTMEDHAYDETRYGLMSRPVQAGRREIEYGDDRATANQEW